MSSVRLRYLTSTLLPGNRNLPNSLKTRLPLPNSRQIAVASQVCGEHLKQDTHFCAASNSCSILHNIQIRKMHRCANFHMCYSARRLKLGEHVLIRCLGSGSCNEVEGGCGSQSPLSDLEFHQTTDETLESLTEFFEDIGDSGCFSSDFDVEYASGVLTVRLGGSNGTYVINKQTPNKQIWLSSPTSGPKRYDFSLNTGRWIYSHDGIALHDLLTKEVSSVAGRHLDFTKCSFGKIL